MVSGGKDHSKPDTFIRLANLGLFDILGSSIVNKIISFVSGMAVVRLIPQVEYGVYGYAYNLLNIVLLFNGLGASSAVLQLASERAFEGRGQDVEHYGLRLGVLVDSLLLVAILVAPLFIDFPVEGSESLFRLFCVTPVLQFVCDLQLVSLRSLLRNKEYALATNINTVLMLVGSVAGAFIGGAPGLIVGRTVSTAATCVTLFIKFGVPCSLASFHRHQFGCERALPTDGLTRKEKRDFLSVAFASALAAGFNQLVFYLGTSLIGGLTSDASSVALYQTTLAIPLALSFIPNALAVFVYPYFARHKDDSDWVLRRYFQLTGVCAAVSLIISVTVSVLAPLVLEFAYGSDYVTAAPALRILMFGWFFSATLRTLGSNLLVTQRRMRFIVIMSIVSIGLISGFSFVLVPTMGIDGAAWAQSAVYIVTGFAYAGYFVLSVKRKGC